MRVCDFWRRDGDLLAENWVFVDALHFLLQLDYDVLQVATSCKAAKLQSCKAAKLQSNIIERPTAPC